MYFTRQQKHLFYFLCIGITRTIAAHVKDLPQQNDGLEEIGFLNRQLESGIVPTTTQFSSTTDSFNSRHLTDFNLKVIAIVVGCFIFGLGLIRFCLRLYNSSRSSNNTARNHRRTSFLRPQIATVELNQFKPDLPPAYAEAVVNIDTDESRLPSYAEVRQANN